MRKLYERILAERERRGASSDVPVDDIVAVVERRGPEETRAAILNRLLASANGRKELELVRAAVRASQPRRLSRLLVPLAIAATLVIAIVGRAIIRSDTAVDPMRGNASGPIALHTPPESVTGADTPRFAWSRLDAADSYELELLDNAGNVVWSEALKDTSVALPANVRLLPGQSYGWRVVAITESGRISSALRTLRVVAR